MCKGYKWRVTYYRQLRNPRPEEWFETLAEVRARVREHCMDGMHPEYSGMLAAAAPICDVPPMRTARGVEVHYFGAERGRIYESL